MGSGSESGYSEEPERYRASLKRPRRSRRSCGDLAATAAIPGAGLVDAELELELELGALGRLGSPVPLTMRRGALICASVAEPPIGSEGALVSAGASLLSWLWPWLWESTGDALALIAYGRASGPGASLAMCEGGASWAARALLEAERLAGLSRGSG